MRNAFPSPTVGSRHNTTHTHGFASVKRLDGVLKFSRKCQKRVGLSTENGQEKDLQLKDIYLQ